MAQPNTTRVNFFSLPIELRTTIYKLAVTFPGDSGNPRRPYKLHKRNWLHIPPLFPDIYAKQGHEQDRDAAIQLVSRQGHEDMLSYLHDVKKANLLAGTDSTHKLIILAWENPMYSTDHTCGDLFVYWDSPPPLATSIDRLNVEVVLFPCRKYVRCPRQWLVIQHVPKALHYWLAGGLIFGVEEVIGRIIRNGPDLTKVEPLKSHLRIQEFNLSFRADDGHYLEAAGLFQPAPLSPLFPQNWQDIHWPTSTSKRDHYSQRGCLQTSRLLYFFQNYLACSHPSREFSHPPLPAPINTVHRMPTPISTGHQIIRDNVAQASVSQIRSDRVTTLQVEKAKFGNLHVIFPC
ncbi:hypothetical protein EJ08DRAFT_699849 [Tothia fuscella]|uniref:Uncharacterized protein n=1 Tax=Tothia fuscella TaxID=1048955 RepID=A0A9P4TWF8_9PEZI|nr:hypothetical protein EJ08DRAFT_699849 [Tothia fuscella]